MKRVLVVDDQPDIRDLVCMTLEMNGYEVHEAPDGEQALQAVARLSPDLVLLDVMMPGAFDGLETCRRLRSGGARRRLPVVMLSARGQPIDHRAGRDAGADVYLTKPFSPRELLEVVNRLT